MPRGRSFKSIIAEVIMYVGMFVIVGHMSQNLYERFLVQSELNCMKSDLSSLQLIVHNIGHAYDALREDIRGLYGNKEVDKPVNSDLKAPDIRPTFDSYLLHKSKLPKRLPKKQDVETSFHKCTKDFMQNFKKSTNNFIQYWKAPVNDVTTFTEGLVKCINVGVGKKDDDVKDFCRCVVRCISHQDDTYKLVNLHSDVVKHPTEIESTLDAHCMQTVTSNKTNSNHPANDLNPNTFKTL